jgi:phosphotransacetylase
MPLDSFDELRAAADRRRPGVPVAAAGADDSTVLQAVAEAQARGWIRAILVGPQAAIRASATAAGVDISAMRVVDAAEPAAAGVAEVRANRAVLLMKGQIDTPSLLRAVLHAETGLRTGETVCQVVLMRIPDQTRTFLLADTGITIGPTLEQKSQILRSLIGVARALGERTPRVAIVSATEKPTASLPDTLEAAELQRRSEAGEFGEAIVQGPLSFDLAYAADAVAKKRVAGAVVGAADAMLFPNLLSANLTVKAIMYTARCRFGGVLCGTTRPVVFMSRADAAETRLDSLALALRVAGES